MARRASKSGGVAAARGFEFQHRVAAWFAVRVLAEENGSPWGLRSGSTLDFIRLETEQPVDDLLVGTSEGGFLFVHVKAGIGLLGPLLRMAGEDDRAEEMETRAQAIMARCTR